MARHRGWDGELHHGPYKSKPVGIKSNLLFDMFIVIPLLFVDWASPRPKEEEPMLDNSVWRDVFNRVK